MQTYVPSVQWAKLVCIDSTVGCQKSTVGEKGHSRGSSWFKMTSSSMTSSLMTSSCLHPHIFFLCFELGCGCGVARLFGVHARFITFWHVCMKSNQSNCWAMWASLRILKHFDRFHGALPDFVDDDFPGWIYVRALKTTFLETSRNMPAESHFSSAVALLVCCCIFDKP